ncbi:MAG: hypothetical protein QW478_14725 [Candidatus Micrarchaeaceae archaeon]
MNKILFEMFALAIISLLMTNTSSLGNVSTNTIVSSLSTTSTPIPVAYRAIILIALIIILIFLGYKFFGLFIKALFLIAIFYLIITLILGIIYTGTLTLKYSITYLQMVYNLFTKGYAVVSSIGNATRVIGNVIK